MHQMIFGATSKFNYLYSPNLQGRGYSEKMHTIYLIVSYFLTYNTYSTIVLS